MEKRQFLKLLSLGFVMAPTIVPSISATPNLLSSGNDEEFWEEIRKSYTIKTDYINLENGYYNFIPNVTMANYQKHLEYMNSEASYYMRTRLNQDKIATRKLLASFVGCDYEELIVTRNTTESLDTVIAGINWKEGDEAIMAQQDYGSMLDMFKLQARRFGMVNKVISVPNHPKTDDEIVDLYSKAITPRTKLIMVCHMINITGQILPIEKICAMAHAKGVEVMVDGAHAVAHINFNIKDLGCDYYGSSLHKWLSVPLGAGLLYVKKDKIGGLWQMFGDSGFADTDIQKLNHTGTHPVATELTITDAIDFQNMIGRKRKEDRLQFLKSYWVEKVRAHPNVILNTPLEAGRSCGIANVGIKNMKPSLLASTLLERYKIWTVAIDYANVRGVRVTPNVYNTTAELDQFAAAILELAGS